MSERFLSRIPHDPATDESIENFAKGVVTGVMKNASPNVVASLLSRIRQQQLEIRGLKQHVKDLDHDLQCCVDEGRGGY